MAAPPAPHVTLLTPSFRDMGLDHTSYDGDAQGGMHKSFSIGDGLRSGKSEPGMQRITSTDLGAMILGEGDEEDTNSATKVIATIGPASRDVASLASLLEAGMELARFDFSWGSPEYHQASLDNLRKAMSGTGRLCATIMDLRGPEIAVQRGDVVYDDEGVPIFWELPPIDIDVGATVVLTPARDPKDSPAVEGNAVTLPLTYGDMASMVEVGDDIFIGRYLATGAESLQSLYVRVSEIRGEDVVCTAATAASLSGLLTVFHIERSVSGCSNNQNTLPTVTDKDLSDIRSFAVRNKPEYVCLSLARTADDVRELRSALDGMGLSETKIIAKVESRIGLVNFESLVVASDAVFVSRANLGLDTPVEKFPILLKSMLRICSKHGTPSIVSRVFDSMIENPRPTRAEATDVANVVLDGADAVLLAAETFRGKFATECVRLVSAIARQGEAVFDHEAEFNVVRGLQYVDEVELAREESLASSAVKAADMTNAVAIVAIFRACGEEETRARRVNLAQLIAKYRPRSRVLALVVPHVSTEHGVHYHVHGSLEAKQLALVRGVIPLLVEPSEGSTAGGGTPRLLAQAAPPAMNFSTVRGARPPIVTGGLGGGPLEDRGVGLAVSLGFAAQGDIVVLVEQLGERSDVVVKAITVEAYHSFAAADMNSSLGEPALRRAKSSYEELKRAAESQRGGHGGDLP